MIARGLGRSYGDPAQNAGGDVLVPLPTEIGEAAPGGSVRVSAGTSLHELMTACSRAARFVPVTPGTRYVTVGGAIACDVHGKSHHAMGASGPRVSDRPGPSPAAGAPSTPTATRSSSGRPSAAWA